VRCEATQFAVAATNLRLIPRSVQMH